MSTSIAEAIFWIAVACSVVAEAAIFRSVLRARAAIGRGAAPAPGSAAPSSGVVPRSRGVVEIVWVVLPAVALVILFAITWRAIHAPADDAGRTGAIAAVRGDVPS